MSCPQAGLAEEGRRMGKHTALIQVSACVKFVFVSLTKISPMAKPRVGVGGHHQKT